MTVYHSVWAIFCKKARVRSSFGSAKNSREGACSTTTPFSMNTVLEEAVFVLIYRTLLETGVPVKEVGKGLPIIRITLILTLLLQ